MSVYSLEGVVPVIDPSSFVHPQATLIGDVIIGPRCYIGPGAALRGDMGRIIVVRLEEESHIGHGAVLHGCTVKRAALVGINAVVMDDVIVGEQSLVGAASFVRAGFMVPPRTLVMGAPARVIRELTAEEIAWKAVGTREYQELTVRCLAALRECPPLTEVPPGRESLSEKPVNTVPLHTLERRK